MLHQTSGRIHNKNVSTHLIGNIRRGERGVGTQKGAEGQASVPGEARRRGLPSSLPWPAPHPVCSAFPLPFTFSSSCPSARPPIGHNSETGGSGLFALCTLDGECPLGRDAVCLWGAPRGPVLPTPACLSPCRNAEAYGGGRQAAVVGAGGSPAFRLRETGCHGERNILTFSTCRDVI